MPSVLVPPRRGRAGVSRLIRSVPCSMRCTGRPRPIPGGGSTRCMTRSAAVTSCGAWVAVRRNSGAPGIDKITLGQVEEYGAGRLLGELASELKEGRYRPLPARRDLYPQAGCACERAEAPFDSSGPRPDRAGRGEDRAQGRSSRPISCRAASGSVRGGRSRMPCRCSSMSARGAAGGWSRRTSRAAFPRFRMTS